MDDSRARLSYKKHGRPLLFCIVTIIGLGVVGYLAYQQFAPNDISKDSIKVQDELPLASVPATMTDKQAYAVSPSHPKYLKISQLGIEARVIGVGVTKEGALDAPKTAWEAGWYKDSATPGSPGAILIDGHVNDNRHTLGVFGRLKDIVDGDEIIIERGDGQQFRYKVVKKEQIPAGSVDMNRMLRPVTPGKPGINLITCGGSYDTRKGSFSDRILVFAEQL
jgi:sortase (surface protein transpeptidase)